MKLKLSYVDLQAWCLAIMSIRFVLHFVPFVGYGPQYSVMGQIAATVSLLLFVFHINRLIFSRQELLLCFLSLIIGYIFYVKYDFYFFLTSASYFWPIALMALSGVNLLNTAFKKFVLLYAVSLVPSVVLYPLIASGAIHPVESITPSLDIKDVLGIYYDNYLLSFKLVEVQSDNIGLFRMSGLFDEAGVVGTFSAFLLMITGYRVKDWKGYTILTAGILSFSFAFYLMSALFLLMRAGTVTRIKVIIFLLFCAAIAGSIPFVQERVLQRFEVKEGTLAGDNRSTEEFEVAFDSYVLTDAVWMGNRERLDESDVHGSATWKALIWDYGVVGTALIAIFFVLLVRSKKIRFNHQRLVFTLLFIASVYQRPHIYEPSFILLFIGGLIYIGHENGFCFKNMARIALKNKPLNSAGGPSRSSFVKVNRAG